MTWKDKLHQHHGVVMMLGCAVPIVIAVIGTYYFGWQQRSYLVWLFLLLCPLMHYWMMKEMHGKDNHSEDKHSEDKSSSAKEPSPAREKRSSCH